MRNAAEGNDTKTSDDPRCLRRLVRWCYAVISGPDRYGHPVLVRFTDTLESDLPEGQEIVRARIQYATNGNVRRWDIMPNRTDETMNRIYPIPIAKEEEREAYERRGRIVAQRIASIIGADLSGSLIYGPCNFKFSLNLNEAEDVVERIKRVLPRWAEISYTGHWDVDDDGKEYTEVSVRWEIDTANL